MNIQRNKNSIWYSDDSRESEISAKKEFLEMKKSGNYENIRFVISNHWASEGYWIEWGEMSKLSNNDFLIENVNINDIWTPK